jgi:RHS repeat-associated protein
MRFGRSSLVSVLATAALALGLVTVVAAPANAALPEGPSTTELTGARPGATELSFAISDRVSVAVDVGTGNLRVSATSLSLVGVNGPVELGRSYNSLASSAGSASMAAANRWTFSVSGVGLLSAGASGSVIYTDGSGATWPFTPVSGTPGAYVAPAGLKADLSASGGGFVLTDRQSRQVVTFNGDGEPVSIADRNGNTTKIGYAAPGVPDQVTSSAGPVAARTAALSYSQPYSTLTATQTSGSSSREVEWVKDTGSNLTSIVDAMGRSTSFGYTGQLLTSITGPGGASVSIGYEAGTDRVVSVSQANTTAGSPGTSQTRLAYPSATETLLARPNTNPSAGVDSVPHVTYTIDAASRLVTAVSDEMGRQRAATYTPNGDVATATSGTGATAGTTTATYGANGGDSLTSLAGPGGATTSTAYANTAAATQYLPSSTTDDAGNTSTYTYNGTGNPLTSTDALAATATLTYNADGTVATALAPGNGSNKTVYGYDANRQLTSVTPVTGSSLGARAFTYDDFGRMRTATDGRGITVTYSDDDNDRLLSTVFSDATPTVTNTYTHTGLPATRVDGNGTTTYGYDQLGRLISRANTFAGGTILYGYDLSSNLTTVTDTRGTTTNAFDASGVPTQITYPRGGNIERLAFATDDQGRRTDSWLRSNHNQTWWAAHTHQDYDTTGRVSRSIGETRTPQGVITVVFNTSYCFNAGSAAPTCSTAPGSDRSKLQWQRDNLTGQVTAYTYDEAGRLLTATQSGGTAPNTYTYTYDSRGNRLTANVTGGTSSSQSFTFNAANQVTSSGYTFDGTGNLTADPAGAYTYNGAEQMVHVANGNGDGDHTYKYAGTSQVEVLQQQSAGSTYRLVYGRTNQVGLPVIEQVQEDSYTAHITNDPVTGQPLMLISSSGIQTLYVYDGLGNPVAMLTDYNSTAYAYAFDPYGVAVLTAGGGGNGVVQNPFLFKGGTQDRATGWVHYGNRWYNPTIGRWTQQDTLDAPLDPANANRYAYAGCDPINNADPTGNACNGAVFALIVSSIGLAASTYGLLVGAPTLIGGAIAAIGFSISVAGVVYSVGDVINSCT